MRQKIEETGAGRRNGPCGMRGGREAGRIVGMPAEATSALARLWSLDPAVTFLNHGSFGACPRPVLEVQARLRSRMEEEPVRFLVRELEARLDEARQALGAFIGADPQDLVFLLNATTGVNAVLRSVAFAPGDELLVTDHEYNACRNALEVAAAAAGARVVVLALPFPAVSEEQVIRCCPGGRHGADAARPPVQQAWSLRRARPKRR